MTSLSQQDPRWASKTMSPGYTIGRYGCLLTDITMMYDWFDGTSMTPDWMASKLTFTNGLLVWGSLSNVGLKCVERVTGRNDAKIAAALADPNQCAALQVNDNHWLFLIGRQIPGLGYKVIDPWDGKTKYTNAYGNNITGSVTIGK